MSNIRWSVVITTKNRFVLARRAIESALAQTIPCEVVVVDDGSADETPSLVGLYPGIRYLRHETSQGHGAAANAGIHVASGTWIKALDDDDVLAPECLEVMAATLEATPVEQRVVMISCGAMNVDMRGRQLGLTRLCGGQLKGPLVLDSATLRWLMMLDQAPLGMTVQVGYSREAALACGGWNPRYATQYGDETEFWIRLAHCGGCVFLPKCLAYRLLWDGGSQKRIRPVVRYRECMKLKKLLDAEMPRDLPSSLALHWGCVALKEWKGWDAVQLFAIWLRKPWSVVTLARSRRFLDLRRMLRETGGLPAKETPPRPSYLV